MPKVRQKTIDDLVLRLSQPKSAPALVDQRRPNIGSNALIIHKLGSTASSPRTPTATPRKNNANKSANNPRTSRNVSDTKQCNKEKEEAKEARYGELAISKELNTVCDIAKVKENIRQFQQYHLASSARCTETQKTASDEKANVSSALVDSESDFIEKVSAVSNTLLNYRSEYKIDAQMVVTRVNECVNSIVAPKQLHAKSTGHLKPDAAEAPEKKEEVVHPVSLLNYVSNPNTQQSRYKQAIEATTSEMGSGYGTSIASLAGSNQRIKIVMPSMTPQPSEQAPTAGQTKQLGVSAMRINSKSVPLIAKNPGAEGLKPPQHNYVPRVGSDGRDVPVLRYETNQTANISRYRLGIPEVRIEEPNKLEPNRITTNNIAPNQMEPNKLTPNNIAPNQMETDKLETDNMKTNKMETDKMEADKIETDKMWIPGSSSITGAPKSQMITDARKFLEHSSKSISSKSAPNTSTARNDAPGTTKTAELSTSVPQHKYIPVVSSDFRNTKPKVALDAKPQIESKSAPTIHKQLPITAGHGLNRRMIKALYKVRKDMPTCPVPKAPKKRSSKSSSKSGGQSKLNIEANQKESSQEPKHEASVEKKLGPQVSSIQQISWTSQVSSTQQVRSTQQVSTQQISRTQQASSTQQVGSTQKVGSTPQVSSIFDTKSVPRSRGPPSESSQTGAKSKRGRKRSPRKSSNERVPKAKSNFETKRKLASSHSVSMRKNNRATKSDPDRRIKTKSGLDVVSQMEHLKFSSGALISKASKGSSPRVAKGSSPRVGKGSSPRVGKGSSPRVGKGSSPRVGKGSSPRVSKGSSPRVARCSSSRIGKGSSPRLARVSSSRVSRGSSPRLAKGSSPRVSRGSSPRVSRGSSPSVSRGSSSRVLKAISPRVSGTKVKGKRSKKYGIRSQTFSGVLSPKISEVVSPKASGLLTPELPDDPKIPEDLIRPLSNAIYEMLRKQMLKDTSLADCSSTELRKRSSKHRKTKSKTIVRPRSAQSKAVSESKLSGSRIQSRTSLGRLSKSDELAGAGSASRCKPPSGLSCDISRSRSDASWASNMLRTNSFAKTIKKVLGQVESAVSRYNSPRSNVSLSRAPTAATSKVFSEESDLPKEESEVVLSATMIQEGVASLQPSRSDVKESESELQDFSESQTEPTGTLNETSELSQASSESLEMLSIDSDRLEDKPLEDSNSSEQGITKVSSIGFLHRYPDNFHNPERAEELMNEFQKKSCHMPELNLLATRKTIIVYRQLRARHKRELPTDLPPLETDYKTIKQLSQEVKTLMRNHERDMFGPNPPTVLDPKYLVLLTYMGEPVCLGVGSHSVVCQAQNTLTGALFAVKFYMKEGRRVTSPRYLRNTLREACVQQQAHKYLPHMVPRLRGLLAVDREQKDFYPYALVTEFVPIIEGSCNAMHLGKLLEREKSPLCTLMFSKKVWLDVLMQLLIGFERLSNLGITHNDIKLDNILLKVSLDRVTPWIIDFGVGLCGEQDTTLILGTPTRPNRVPDMLKAFPHLSPEFFTQLRVYPNSDVYGFGLIMTRIGQSLWLPQLLSLAKRMHVYEVRERPSWEDVVRETKQIVADEYTEVKQRWLANMRTNHRLELESNSSHSMFPVGSSHQDL